MQNKSFEACVSYRGAAIAPHQGVRGTGGQAQRQGNQIPDNCSQKAGEKNFLVDQLDMHHPFADGGGHRGAEYERRNEIPEGGPQDSTKGSKHAGGNDGGDGIGGIVPAIRKFKGQSQKDGYQDENESAHGDQAFFRMTLSITFETSSHLSTAVSITSKISFHLMI